MRTQREYPKSIIEVMFSTDYMQHYDYSLPI